MFQGPSVSPTSGYVFLNDKYQTATTGLKFNTLFYVPLQKCNQNYCLKEFSEKNFLENLVTYGHY
jgi:hypothetical protein